MPKLRQVDASQVCDELQALCNAAECFLRGIAPQGHKRATTHAQCLYQLLGDSPDSIVAKSGNSLTTTFLRELSQDIPWRFIVMGADLSSECDPLTAEQIKILRRWLELIRNAERKYTDLEIPKKLLCQHFGNISSDTLARRIKADPGMIHSSHSKHDMDVRVAVDALVETELYSPDLLAAAVFKYKSEQSKAKKKRAAAKNR